MREKMRPDVPCLREFSWWKPPRVMQFSFPSSRRENILKIVLHSLTFIGKCRLSGSQQASTVRFVPSLPILYSSSFSGVSTAAAAVFPWSQTTTTTKTTTPQHRACFDARLIDKVQTTPPSPPLYIGRRVLSGSMTFIMYECMKWLRAVKNTVSCLFLQRGTGPVLDRSVFSYFY